MNKRFRATGTDKAPTAAGKTMAGYVKLDGGHSPKGSSSKKSLDKTPRGPDLKSLHSGGKTVASWQAERLSKLSNSGPKTKSGSN